MFSLVKILKVTFFLFISFQAYSQDLGQEIDELINSENYGEAIKVGGNHLKDIGNDPELNFKIGYCYMNTVLKKKQAIPYFLKSTKHLKNPKSEISILTNFYLGQAYHKNYEFEKALEVFTQLKESVSNKNMLKNIDKEIEQCEVGIELKKNPVKMQVANLGKTINTCYSEHSPVISADESVLIFTSRRKPDSNIEMKPDGQYDEDIYLSRFDGAKWGNPVSISENINTRAHEASIGISADGQELFIYSETDGGTILSSKLIGAVWSKPSKLGNGINTRWRETHASVSADGNYLYFTSDRPGGYGGLDIYVSKKGENGDWGKPENLGPVINTSDDEESPFIHFDGTTLYFSSKGHPTMGGYDIFYSKKLKTGNWTNPENMGYPVNTTENDAFFVTNPNGKRAYYASYKENGLGRTDIYTVELPELEDKNVVVVNGEITICEEYREMVDIEVIDEDTRELLGTYHPNSKSGEFLFVLKKGKKYEIIFKVDGQTAYTENFDIAINDTYKLISFSVNISQMLPCSGEIVDAETETKIIEEPHTNEVSDDFVATRSLVAVKKEDNTSKTFVENIMYRKNSAEYTYFKYNLNRLAGYLKKHRDCKIEIVGYADTQGTETYNLKLSWSRAKHIYWYLLKKGVYKSQLSYRGDGEKNQITVNKYQNGRYVERSLVYNRRVEFIIVNDDNNGLIINRFEIPEIYQTEEKINSNQYLEYKGKYTIQLGAYQLPASPDRYNKLKGIKVYFTGKYYLYSYGTFESEKEAQNKLEEVRELGYKTAYVREISEYFPSTK